jgi:hypothetical protein
MRPAGTSTAESLRAPAAAITLRRPSGQAQGEALRGPGTAVTEARRAAAERTSEYLTDPYYRLHPPQLGCTIYSIQAIPGLGAAGCMVAGVDRGMRP